MKVEGGGVATSSAVLHKIKVKEEAKECCSSVLQQPAPSLSAGPSSSPPRVTTGLAIGAIATITIGSGCGEIAAAVAKQSAEPFPVDLDLKSRPAKAQGAARDPSGPDSRCSSSPSPSSSPGPQQQIRIQHSQSQQQQQQPTRVASSSSSGRSGDSDDQAPLQSVKSEREATEERPRDKTGTGGGRRLAGILATHTRLKRLLGTLVHFAMDISSDTGEAVRALVLGLLSGSMSAEEFHSALQEATNFPLRGFVLPYLKHTLPPLQRDLSAAARADNQRRN
ncbi:PREDICTED: protein CBFA2T3-like [Ceratosolen solmsi marchali]|uniref:Protein CBFA2T3-like n=1 Tax=Ceratosolen solmsi marchali TaxID=326594 RepID=A0AAJ7E1H3_9HYME|nr:PREDICTED: protein CBFA2T3-like [Ceratosolen solmsi marchali]